MTQSQAKTFSGRCVLKELFLAGHGSGKYPAVQCICNSLLFPIPPTKSWPFKGMMDELVMLVSFPFLMFFSSYSFFSPIRWRLKLCPCECSKANSAPSLLTVSNHFKGWCQLWPEPFGTWLLCSDSRQELRFVICRWHEQCLLVAVEAVLQSTFSNVRFDCPSSLMDWFCW